MKKILTLIIIILIAGLVGIGAYWYFFVKSINPNTTIPTNTPNSSGFSPFNNSTQPSTQTNTQTTTVSTTTTVIATSSVNIVETYKVPKLRQLSTGPVAGIAASSTASSSLVRFIDRGTGHVYEANNISSDIVKISNTTLPKVYESYANKMGTNFIVRYLKDESDTITNFYTELRKTGTSTTETAYQLKGKYISPDIDQIAVSPSGDKVFTWNIENGRGVGYVSGFDEKNKTKVIDTPLTQVTADWPETNTITITTKASAISSGYMYSINSKTGLMKSILTGFRGLAGKMSRDGTKVLYSSRSSNTFTTSIMNLKDNSSEEVLFKTLADKCTWSTLRKNEIYCAVPTQIENAVYPDDWYTGNISFIDQIWYLNTTTGEVHLLSNLLAESSQLIDAINLTLDPKEDTLYFMNKRDLTLWALDLKQ